ncbi:hypothetical protein SAY86_011020 [Trapa natans]|uniref:Uncharacterized protein n=1 Tax=Trapa natans TaxID=22666 RepID=A0AAN7R2D8_TRANT|nr:hypothetical protein SAY86_011020 [Trapa natans]
MPPKEHRNRDRERDALVVERVIGDVLDPFTPTISLGVNYAGQDVINGCQLRPSQVVSGPRIDIGGNDFRIFYTLASFESNILLSLYVIIYMDRPAPFHNQLACHDGADNGGS